MNWQPKISVIVPVYKAEKYLRRCIDSLLAQTFTDFEVLLIDDGSPDNSGDICDEYAAKDNRVRVWHWHNRGVVAARRRGVELAKGEYLTFLDADDALSPDALAFFEKTMRKGEYDIIQTNYIYLQSNGSMQKGLIIYNGTVSSNDFIRMLLVEECPVGVLGKSFRKNILDGGTMNISEKITNNEDLLINVKAAKKAEKIGIFPYNYTYNYFRTEGSASQKFAGKQHWLLVYNTIWEIISGTKCLRECERYIAKSMWNEKRIHNLQFQNTNIFRTLYKHRKMYPIFSPHRFYLYDIIRHTHSSCYVSLLRHYIDRAIYRVRIHLRRTIKL